MPNYSQNVKWKILRLSSKTNYEKDKIFFLCIHSIKNLVYKNIRFHKIPKLPCLTVFFSIKFKFLASICFHFPTIFYLNYFACHWAKFQFETHADQQNNFNETILSTKACFSMKFIFPENCISPLDKMFLLSQNLNSSKFVFFACQLKEATF